MRVIGTAGHVDHGKSALVEALTGINPDRLREERERQMTIDLGFAWFNLPDGEPIGIIDVPGHRDFIENMLAGVGGIDAALFVIAADEGVMPQSREHLAILDLLEVDRGVVALTKTDLVEDQDWVGLVHEEVAELLMNTHLASAPIVPVSVHQNEGLQNLIRAIADSLQGSPARPDLGKPRLSIDRAFSIAGFGTVVTGTLIDGCLKSGDEIEILPGGIRGRIRGLQTHKTQLDQARPGSRVAVNLTGIEVRQIERGDVLVLPETYQPSRLVDVSYRHLSGIGSEMRHNQQVKLFHGSAQTLARVRLLGEKKLMPGKSGWLQLELQRPIVAVRGDRFILRRPSPGATLGGGKIVDPQPIRKHKRMDAGVISRFEQLLEGTADDLLYQALIGAGPVMSNSVSELAGLSQSEIESGLEHLVGSGQILMIDSRSSQESVIMAKADWESVVERVGKIMRKFHDEQPLKLGMAREELKSRLNIDGKAFPFLLSHMQAQGILDVGQTHLALQGHAVNLTQADQERIDRIMKKFASNPHRPPSLKESMNEIGDDLLGFLLDTGKLVKVATDVVFEAETYQAMIEQIIAELGKRGTITVAEVRDIFGTTRKYSLALMEHLDAIGVTIREGDLRRLA
jgi:selenocysteine-specific elongation factor